MPIKTLAAFAVAGVLTVSGCGMRLYRPSPQELEHLETAEQAALDELRDEVVHAATAWQFATREREIAELHFAAAKAKSDVAADLGAWADRATAAYRKALVDDAERDFAYCRARYGEIDGVVEREIAVADARLEAAEAAELEARRTYELADMELGRARAAYGLDRPGVLVEDREKDLALWRKFVDRASSRATAARVERKQADIRAEDQRKAWLGVIYDVRRRFEDACPRDWALPDRGATAAAPAAAVRDAQTDAGPLAVEAAPQSATAPAATTQPAAASEPVTAPAVAPATAPAAAPVTGPEWRPSL